MVDADSVFNLGDFASIRLVVYFKNTTTRTEVKSKNKVALVEVGDKVIVLDMPPRSCNVKHNVLVDIKRIDSDGKTEKHMLSVTGKVLDVEEGEDDSMRVTIECIQYDEMSWKNLMSLFSSRQDEIEKFFAAVKG